MGATILTDMLSLFVLAICLTTHKTGFDPRTLAIQVGELILFIAVMIYVVGPVGRWAFNKLGRSDEACFTLMMANRAGPARLEMAGGGVCRPGVAHARR